MEIHSYVLGDAYGGNREAFDALEGAFGSMEFTASEAVAVVQGAIGITELEASRLVKSLIASNVMKEV